MLYSPILSLLFTLACLFNEVVGQDNNRNKGGNNNNTNGNAVNNANTVLNPQVIQKASNSNGTPKDGQTASITDPDNFINFCKGKTLTDGKQLTGGSCNGIVMGDIPSKDNMIAAIIVNPQVGKTIAPNTPFDVAVQVQNLAAGVFTNPDVTYYSAPQQLRGGKVIGHCHVVIQKMQSFTDTTPPSAATFAFFKGINDDGNGRGLLKATVTAGLPEGFYRVCTMMGTSNHQPPLMPVAQRGAQEDCTKFQVTANGNNNNAGNTGTGNNGNRNGQTTTTTAANNAKAQSTTASTNGASTTGTDGQQGGKKEGERSRDGTNSSSRSTTAATTTAQGNRNGMKAAETVRGDSAAQTASASSEEGKRREGRDRWERSTHARRHQYAGPHLPVARFMARPLIV